MFCLIVTEKKIRIFRIHQDTSNFVPKYVHKEMSIKSFHYSSVLELIFLAHEALGAVLSVSVVLFDAFFTCMTAKQGTLTSLCDAVD